MTDLDPERLPPPPRPTHTELIAERQHQAIAYFVRKPIAWVCWVNTLVFILRYSVGMLSTLSIMVGLCFTTGTFLTVLVICFGLKVPSK